MINLRRSILAIAFGAVGLVALLGYTSVGAKADTTLSDAELKVVQNNCIALKNTLDQLNYSDTALRVNQGQYYEEISTKLMTPMNSRIALNKYDSGNLTSITADYVKEIDTFREDYTAYAKALSQARHDNCSERPQNFYDDIVAAASARQTLHESVVRLNDMVKDYAKTFKDFAKTLPENASGVRDE